MEYHARLRAHFDLPEVNAFAVSNLLFPGQSILSFQNAYVPGDLLLVGDVQVPSVVSEPLMVTLSNAQTQQFNATSPPNVNQAVEWFVSGLGVDNPAAGTINQQGLYTAPASISSPQIDVVTAMGSTDQTTSSSVVTLVPAEIMVSPLFVLITPDSLEAQQFTAVMPTSDNQEIDWSINPQVGSNDANGNYTPPDTISEPTAVILSAASQTNPSIQGIALIALLPSDPQLIAVNPSITPSPLSASQTCLFQASTPLQTVNWSVLPEIGSISQDGLYTAPNQIDQLQTVLVVAAATWNDTTYYGTGLVILSPAST